MLHVYYTIRIVNRYSFLIETYSTERQKILGVWAMFKDEEMPWRPHPRARSVHEHMVHQCVSEDHWMKNFLGIDLGEPPLPALETKREFIKKYAASSSARMGGLEAKPESWFEDTAQFFDVRRSRAWILVRRIAHSAHHRGQLTTYLRVLGHELYSTYGPTADTGGLFQDGARVIYQYPDIETLLVSEARGGVRPPLPGPVLNRRPSVRSQLRTLKRVLQRKLQFPGGLSGQDLAEHVVAHIHECRDRVGYGVGSTGHGRDKAVRHIERIDANLQALFFPSLKIPRQRHIETPKPRTDDAVPPQIPYRAKRLRRESRQVQVRTSCAALSGIRLVRKHEVRPLMIDSVQLAIGSVLDCKWRARREPVDSRELPASDDQSQSVVVEPGNLRYA